MKGKDVTELIAPGREKLASVPCGGGGLVAAAPGASAAAATPAAAEAKKEEKVEEKAESSDDVITTTHIVFPYFVAIYSQLTCLNFVAGYGLESLRLKLVFA
ncbi:hypothetical protein J1N35_041475 [Gossypium stocksii]|uniref:Uncharacterized protein n=1 Tax=Gossypium stocksii TaxID=47602 RepID=A0A9D3ZJB4_9ROSI|nr:hypothetical protein J1N35_041475 [Gossypium stocksii]